MAKRPVVMKLATCQPVDYKESSILKALESDGQLLAETKHDGVQLNLVVKDGETHFLSRAGIEFEALGFTTSNLSALLQLHFASSFNGYKKGYVIQGELVALNAAEQPLAAAMTAGILRRKDVPEYAQKYAFVMFGILPLDEVEGTESINITREMLNVQAKTFLWGLKQIAAGAHYLKPQNDLSQLSLEVVQQIPVFRLEDDTLSVDGATVPSLMGAYREARHHGYEGLVVWKIGAVWHRGKKTGGWKIKPNETYDGKIIGFFKGDAVLTKNLIVGFEVQLEDGHVVKADGLTDALSFAVTKNPSQYMDAQVEVSCMERFANGSLRHPKFKDFRGINDKTVKE